MKHLLCTIALLILMSNYLLAQEFIDPATTTDWNTVWKSSFLQGNGAANAPENTGWFWGLNMNHSSNSESYRYNGQIAIKNASNSPTMYFRSTTENGTGVWTKVLHNTGDQEIKGKLTLSGSEANKPLLYVKNNYYNSTKTEGTSSLQFAFADHLGPKIEASKLSINMTALNFYTEYGFNIPQLAMTIEPGPNGSLVGIGTNNPTEKLHVNGTILALEVKVSTAANNVPDYVFKEGYELTSLADLELYIKTNSHLPEVPSAEEIEANGLELAKMNLLLLKKIEELTLYLIEERKTNSEQQEQIQSLKIENKEIRQSNQTEIEYLKREFKELKEMYFKGQNK